MKHWKVFAAGAVYGLLMRIAFGLLPFLHSERPGGASGPMMGSFVLLVPALIGAWTVWRMPPEKRRWTSALTGPWVPTLCFVGGTALLLIEGSICIAMALPIFLAMASLGGLLAFGLRRLGDARPGAVNALMALPLVAGFAEARLEMPEQAARSVGSVHIAAPAPVIWHLINNAEHIQPAEMQQGLAYRIGLPYPQQAITVQMADGSRVRQLRWDKGVHFDEPIVDWQENRYIRWTYAFQPDSFPPGALDEHVLIGGRYFDLRDTAYRLTPEAGGTRLDIEVNYRVSTNFNFYAAWVGRLLVDDAAATILRFYQQRGQQASRDAAPHT